MRFLASISIICRSSQTTIANFPILRANFDRTTEEKNAYNPLSMRNRHPIPDRPDSSIPRFQT